MQDTAVRDGHRIRSGKIPSADPAVQGDSCTQNTDIRTGVHEECRAAET